MLSWFRYPAWCLEAVQERGGAGGYLSVALAAMHLGSSVMLRQPGCRKRTAVSKLSIHISTSQHSALPSLEMFFCGKIDTHFVSITSKTCRPMCKLYTLYRYLLAQGICNLQWIKHNERALMVKKQNNKGTHATKTGTAYACIAHCSPTSTALLNMECVYCT